VSWIAYGVAAWIFIVGLYGIATSRNIVHMIICLSVVQSSTYVLLLAIGYKTGGTAPVFYDVSTSRRAVDPVVQALTLTDIVVGVTVTALLLAVAVQLHKRYGTLDPTEIKPTSSNK
jgi:multicomponent Na+:H+ antiporter subunit C